VAVGIVSVGPAFAESVRLSVRDGNKLYAQGNFNEALNKYDEALVDNPQALPPRFNKANSYYRLDDLAQAMDLYQQVAAESRDMKLVAKAKYNLGNSFFQRGSKQKDSDFQKALDDLETSITYWRQVLDLDPKKGAASEQLNVKAARNIEVARLMIKDILDQLNKQKQQQDPNQPRDPNQPQQPKNQQGQSQPQDQMNQQQQDPNQPSQASAPQDPNKPEDKQQASQPQQREEFQAVAPDTTAQEILDKEQRQKEQRQILQRGGYQKVDKDW
jgi:tetratricopeptide (TPR) repeat protein